jgi:hypothetical protein
MIDVLVLDEADRMVQDGHFKEMHKILEYIYTKRVQFKRQNKSSNPSGEIVDGKQFVASDDKTN